jgi:hypothetical protein
MRGGKRYRYYLCCGAHRRGRQSCPAKSIPARVIEQAVLEQIQTRDPNVDVRTETPGGHLRLVRLWIGRVDYDGAQNKVAITFNPVVLRPGRVQRQGDPLRKDFAIGSLLVGSPDPTSVAECGHEAGLRATNTLFTFVTANRTCRTSRKPASRSQSEVSPVAWLRPVAVATRSMRFSKVGQRGDVRSSFRNCA